MQPKVITLALLIFTLLLSSKCEKNDETDKVSTKHLPVGDSIELTQKIAYQNDAADLRIVFDSIINDSRCPENTQCFTQGYAKVAVKIEWQDQEESAILNSATKKTHHFKI